MGCKSSKAKEPRDQAAQQKADANNNNAENKNPADGHQAAAKLSPQQPADTKRAEVATPDGRAAAPAGRKNNDASEASSRTGPPKKIGGPGGGDGNRTPPASVASQQRQQELDEDGNPVVLPKGDWVRTEGTPFYYSEKENLYFHPPSCQFYDPTNEMWYDPEKDEWYRDDDGEEEQQ
ncbi:hypothetical protein LSM04_009378 [Trypanosoma melophagium]|uniref:uncharacterized protein n=1 Tax=Trypanosoma melophagium TaxID=715481 RepID=UPI00351A6660|nr:hypothetical protein LSM04_009378 [Trypanosoma melophagium]